MPAFNPELEQTDEPLDSIRRAVIITNTIIIIMVGYSWKKHGSLSSQVWPWNRPQHETKTFARVPSQTMEEKRAREPVMAFSGASIGKPELFHADYTPKNRATDTRDWPRFAVCQSLLKQGLCQPPNFIAKVVSCVTVALSTWQGEVASKPRCSTEGQSGH